MIVHPLTDRELATVLAALRYWQQDLLAYAEGPIDSCHFDDATPLSVAEIDQLCEQLNGPSCKD